MLTPIIYLTGGDDYVSGPYNVMIPAGQTNIKFDVTIMDDNVVENVESINLAINSSRVPIKITLGNTNRTVVNIVDNDG